MLANGDAALFHLAGDEVHGRLANEASHEHIHGVEVDLLGGTHLLHIAILHHHDAVSHGHGLGLVVSHVDGGSAGLTVDLGDLGAHGHALLGVQVGQGFVHQEDAHLADDGATHRHALALAAGQGAGHTIQILGQAQDLGGLLHPLLDHVLVHALQVQAKGQVVVHGHIGIEGIALEHHGHFTLAGTPVVGQLAIDEEITLADVLQSGDHAQRGGLAAAGGADEHDELTPLGFQVEVMHGVEAIGIDLVDILQRKVCHGGLLLYLDVCGKFCHGIDKTD